MKKRRKNRIGPVALLLLLQSISFQCNIVGYGSLNCQITPSVALNGVKVDATDARSAPVRSAVSPTAQDLAVSPVPSGLERVLAAESARLQQQRRMRLEQSLRELSAISNEEEDHERDK